MNTQIFQDIQRSPDNGADEKHAVLGFSAFTGQHELVREIFQRIPDKERKNITDKYIFNQAIWGGIQKMRKFQEARAEALIKTEKAFIDDTLNLFLNHCQQSDIYPRELFQSILYWSEELLKMHRPDEALEYIDRAFQIGVNKFPDLNTQLLNRKALIYSNKGELDRAFAILAGMAQRPFFLSDRNQIPHILYNLAQVTLKRGDVFYYKRLLFLGLRQFYPNFDDRRYFIDQLSKTYRRSFYLLLHNEVRLTDKFLFLIHWMYYKLPNFRRLYMGFVNKIFKLGILGYVYVLNYILGDDQYRKFDNQTHLYEKTQIVNVNSGSDHLPGITGIKNHKHILITRAMGGIGDLLTMTPGIHALKLKYPDEKIHLAIPRRYFALFEGNPDVELLDIENDDIQYRRYKKWFNFTDCPAARVESRTAPRVKKSRIRIFAQALGIRGIRLWRMDRRPRYFLSRKQQSFREDFWRRHGLTGKMVVGVQLHADEVYRDYPYMEQLVREISKSRIVIVFHDKPIREYNFSNVIKADAFNLQQAFAIASRCDAIIAPDSSFLHLAAALEIPCVGLFGPIDGQLRTNPYPFCEYLDARQNLGCIPCWRNENIPCKLTNMRTSVCMSHIPIVLITSALERQLAKHSPKSYHFEQKLQLERTFYEHSQQSL